MSGYCRRGAAVLLAGLFLLATGVVAPRDSAAEAVKVGLLKVASGGPIFIALDRGYFSAEGLTVAPVYFPTAQPISTAVAAGDIDFGSTGLTAAVYTLAGQGVLRIVAGQVREVSGFHDLGYVASNRAYGAGMTAFKDFPGHSVALPVIGSPPHYSLQLLAAKYGFDIKTLRLLQLQTNANQVSAVSGGQADIGLITASVVLPAIQHGDLKLLAWVGDETPWQLGAVFTATKTANDRRETVERFLRGYRKGAHDYLAAFAGPDGKRRDGPTAHEILALIGKYIGQSPDVVAQGVPFIDADLRLDSKDILRQIEWYRSQGFVKGQFDSSSVIDGRYVLPLPEH